MKKICLLFIFNLFYVGSVLGESLEFVTTLSQPVGSFAKVNVGNKVSVEALQVNFCNATVDTGTIEMSGAMRAASIKLEDGTQLSGNVPVYKLQTLNLGDGGVFSAGNMIINQADPSVLSAYKIYANDMSYLIGELGSLKLPDGTMVQQNAKITNQDLWWSNEYNCNYAVQDTPPSDIHSVGTEKPNGDSEADLRDTCDDNPYVRFEGNPTKQCRDVFISWCGATGQVSKGIGECPVNSPGMLSSTPNGTCPEDLNKMATDCCADAALYSGCSRDKSGEELTYNNLPGGRGNLTSAIYASSNLKKLSKAILDNRLFVFACRTNMPYTSGYCTHEPYLYCKTKYRVVYPPASPEATCLGSQTYTSYLLKTKG